MSVPGEKAFRACNETETQTVAQTETQTDSFNWDTGVLRYWGRHTEAAERSASGPVRCEKAIDAEKKSRGLREMLCSRLPVPASGL